MTDVQDILVFTTMIFVVLFVFMYMLYKYFVRKIDTQQRQAMQAVLDAQENERRLIAKEVHDNLGPLLSISGMQLEAAMDDFKEHDVSLLSDAYKQLKQAIDICRSISHELTPFLNMDSSLDEILQEYTQRVCKTGFIAVNYEYALDNVAVSQQVSASLCRIVLELMTNTIKHAYAKNIIIRLMCQHNVMLLHYCDDGVGLQENSNAGIGMRNIQSRVHLLNGQMQTGQYDGRGLEIKIKIPIAQLSV